MKLQNNDNVLRNKMNAGTPVVGSYTHIGGQVAIECMGLSGLDFVIIDTEHAPFTMQEASDMVRAAEIVGISSVIRVQDHTRPSLHKALNTNADALIIPCIETVEEIDEMLKEGRFYPMGKHNFPYARNSMWNAKVSDGLQTFYNRENKRTMLIPQCETVGFLENIEEIMAKDGVDGLFVGPFDLSADMGIIGQFDHPDFLKARERIIKACQDNGKFAWAYCPDTQTAKKNIADGFNGSAIGMDQGVFTEAYRAIVDEMQKEVSEDLVIKKLKSV